MNNSKSKNSSKPGPKRKFRETSLSVAVAVVAGMRVIIVLVVWLALFLGMFIGYFTLPIVLMGILVLVYSLFDLGLVFYIRRREQGQEAREEFIIDKISPRDSDTSG